MRIESVELFIIWISMFRSPTKLAGDSEHSKTEFWTR